MPSWSARRRGDGGRAATRRSGPPDEAHWWDDHDQAVVQQPLLHRTDLGRRWASTPMPNNVERLDPLGDDPASDLVRAARADRRLTALDEGRALRRRDGVLLVLRVEAFADEGGDGVGEPAPSAAHRAAWRANAEASLDATWRERWSERDLVPGWIEARWLELDERPMPLHALRSAGEPDGPPGIIDWVRIEDHTDPAERRSVTVYEHLTVWAERFHLTLTVRHPLETAFDDVAAVAAHLAAERLVGRTSTGG